MKSNFRTLEVTFFRRLKEKSGDRKLHFSGDKEITLDISVP